VNVENLSPAMMKAIETGGTNNAVIGRALVKRGIFMEAGTGPEPSAGHPFRYIPFPAATIETPKTPEATVFTTPADRAEEWTVLRADMARGDAENAIAEAERRIAALNLPAGDMKLIAGDFELMRTTVAEGIPYEAARLAVRTVEVWNRVIRLRAAYATAPDWRKERISIALATLGTVVYPEGTPEYAEYRAKLTEELNRWKNGEAAKEERYRIEFERIGRFYEPRDFHYHSAETPDDVMKRLREFVEHYLTSRSFSITFEDTSVLIEGGRFGRGRVRPAE
jgi:hypothetical protein